MSIIQNIKTYGMSGLIACSSVSCQVGPHAQYILENSRKEALKTIGNNKLTPEETKRLMDGEEKAVSSIWALDNNVLKSKYWDSIRTEALVKKAYLEGAQMVRDSIAAVNLKKLATDSIKHIK